jgi:hypothetical protein
MAEYSNRPGLKPYCLYHAVPMTADSNEQTEHSQPAIHSYICHFAGCDLNWERRLGYFKTATTQSTFQFGIGAKRCPVPDHAFLVVSGFSMGDRLWMCSVDGCNHTEVESSGTNG